MEIYNYHRETGEFISATQARPNPEDAGQFLIPAFATQIRPPAIKDKEAAVFNGSVWQVMPDYRETTYWLPDGTENTITALNMPIPEDALLEKPVRQSTLKEQIDALSISIDAFLDKTAQERGYTDTLFICSYGDTNNEKFDIEAKIFKTWRSNVWAHFFAVCGEILSGKRQMPTEDELFEIMPVIDWAL